MCILKIKKKQQNWTTKKQQGNFFFHWRQNLDQSSTSIQPGNRGRLCRLAFKAGKYEEGIELLSWHQAKSPMLQTRESVYRPVFRWATKLKTVLISERADSRLWPWSSFFLFVCNFVWTKVQTLYSKFYAWNNISHSVTCATKTQKDRLHITIEKRKEKRKKFWNSIRCKKPKTPSFTYLYIARN